MKPNPTINKLFVNRDCELRAFCNILESPSPTHIMTIHSEGGMGKSWLLARFYHECSLRNMKVIEIDFQSSLVQDYLAILRRARDTYGAKEFDSFTGMVNQYTEPRATIQIGGGTQSPSSQQVEISGVKESQVETVGRDIIVIKDNYFPLPATTHHTTLEQIREKITAEFKDCLQKQTAKSNTPSVWLLDHFEHASAETISWLEDQFLVYMRDQTLERTVMVIAGRMVPQFGIAWKHAVSEFELKTVTVDDFAIYSAKLGVPIGRDAITWLHKAFDGNLQKFAIFLEGQEGSR